MKYNYHVPSYTRTSQYTPSYTPTYHTPTHYTSTTPNYTSAYTSTAKYTPTQYSSTKYTPSLYTSTYKSAATYIPSYSKESRYSSTQRTQAQEKPAPVIPVAPVKKTVHFPNDIIFQDIVRRGDMEQIGRFMRARKVRVDTIFHSGMAAIHEAVLTGSLEVVKLLVKYGPMFIRETKTAGRHFTWPAVTATRNCQSECVSKAKGSLIIEYDCKTYLLSTGASTVAENENGEKPADLIDPDCKELVKLFETGCV
ncbi:Protein phosphatase 1 regulatory subunit 27 [Dissostichus eleginoides]|uniref:Protein phosphatase 1 regulatory subunit 27 n=1 Tax=Dissostichus eleginoides TaxID=100907 RepID=A0AAD9B703_DISEL|nr:Protein phosphatase 1 regulatory subunit 27 [Dissostichus eleginoides]